MYVCIAIIYIYIYIIYTFRCQQWSWHDTADAALSSPHIILYYYICVRHTSIFIYIIFYYSLILLYNSLLYVSPIHLFFYIYNILLYMCLPYMWRIYIYNKICIHIYGRKGPLSEAVLCVCPQFYFFSLFFLDSNFFPPRCQQSYDIANAALSECQKLRTGHCAEHLSAEVTFAEVTIAQVC